MSSERYFDLVFNVLRRRCCVMWDARVGTGFRVLFGFVGVVMVLAVADDDCSLLVGLASMRLDKLVAF